MQNINIDFKDACICLINFKASISLKSDLEKSSYYPYSVLC
jgi:hypothetical protein